MLTSPKNLLFMKKLITAFLLGSALLSCNNDTLEKKGFQVSEIVEDNEGKKVVGLQIDSLKLETRPRNVLITKNDAHRLTPIYKVNYHKKTGHPFTGSNHFHSNWADHEDGNNWNENFMPGLEAVYGYNFVNVSHYNLITKSRNELFNKPVLIRTLYYPAFSKDTLNYQPVNRDYYMVSVYDEDTNKDGFINVADLRRFYLFDIEGKLKKQLIPKNYSVMSSEYDSANDLMYVFTKLDANNNGKMDEGEATHIFWIDLENPEMVGLLYGN